MKISYSYGIMDLFHYGHLKALETASKGADLHIVGLVSDKAAKNWMGAVVSNERERRAVLENIKCVDWVMPQENLDPTENLKKLHLIYPEAEITLFRGDDISVIAAREYLKTIGGKVQSIDYYERLSPAEILKALNERAELSDRHSAVISTKANTLSALKERIKRARIEEIEIVTVREAREKPKVVSEKIAKRFKGKKIVVRSSSVGEDGFESSNAGHYESILNVDSNNEKATLKAIRTVYESYGKDGEIGPDEQILVQTQTQNVKYSGVVFTRDIQQNRPYYVINYDDSGSTDSVTSGSGGKCLQIAQNASPKSIPAEWQGLFFAVKELESILSKMLLDIEFAVTKSGEVVIFQVRPLAASYKFGRINDAIKLLEKKDQEKTRYKNTLMSDMAFWNPAEIIGTNPRPLDYSLYRHIITHRAWNEGLVPMGYRRVSQDLMLKCGNKPYIRVDYAFLSLIPSSVSGALAGKLKDFYLSKLKRDLSAHDKIEFEIALSSFDFSTTKKLAELQREGFTKKETEELKAALLALTSETIKTYKETLAKDLDCLKELERVRTSAEAVFTKAKSVQDRARITCRLLEATRTYGTPQFARHARCAFMARSMADSLKKEKIWTVDEYNSFMASIATIATDFERDFKKYSKKQITKKTFDEKYGHLRAGTYDITKSRYDAMDVPHASGSAAGKEISFEKKTIKVTIPDSVLAKAGFKMDSKELLAFMKESLERREYFKYIFTKSLSRAIEFVAQIAEGLKISRKDISYFDINEILSFSFYGTEDEIQSYVEKTLPTRQAEHALLSKMILPSVIAKPEDFDFIQTVDDRPNFITTKKTIAKTVLLDNEKDSDICGKIVVIEKADPGYDWIFAKKIAGLVTRYGGAASHMAIRCAEFEIPAAIGCGEKIFSFVCRQNSLEIDCKNGKIRSVTE